MCLYPTLMPNRKYQITIKNGGNVPPVSDPRTLWVPVACGNCIECRKTKARDWQIRLSEDIRTNTNGKFITLTFNNDSIKKLEKYTQDKINDEIKIINTNRNSISDIDKQINQLKQKKQGYKLDNEIAKNAIRLFLERWRKQYKTSLRHWLVTELGHTGTENIHLHGIVWTNNIEELGKIWNYGYVWYGKTADKKIRNFVNEKTINYVVKYIHKVDKDHKHYKSKILCSKGIGNNYINRIDAKLNEYRKKNTNETYKTRQGQELNLPIYYRNKIYNDKEKEELWIEKLDKNIRYVLGKEINISESYDEYFENLERAQEKNIRLGYKTNLIDWEQKAYEEQKRKILLKKRLE